MYKVTRNIVLTYYIHIYTVYKYIYIYVYVILSENEVIRVWLLRVFVVCGFLRFLNMLVVFKNVSSKNVNL